MFKAGTLTLEFSTPKNQFDVSALWNRGIEFIIQETGERITKRAAQKFYPGSYFAVPHQSGLSLVYS